MAKQKNRPAKLQTVVRFPCCVLCATQAAQELRQDFEVNRHDPQVISVNAPQAQVDETLNDMGFMKVGERRAAVYEFIS